MFCITSFFQAIRIYISSVSGGDKRYIVLIREMTYSTFFVWPVEDHLCCLCEANWIQQSTKPSFTARRESFQEIKYKGIVSMKTAHIQHFKHITVTGKDWQREHKKLKTLDRFVKRQ